MAESYSTKGFIKGIYLQLPEYSFRHRHFSNKHSDNFKFIGRELVKDQFIEILLNGSNSGAYLVTGYRGMGKTSFIHKVLQEYDEKLKKIRKCRLKTVQVSFGKSDVNHGDIIKQIILALQNNLLSRTHRLIIWLTKSFQIFNLTILLYLAILAFVPSIISKDFSIKTIINNIFRPEGDWKAVVGLQIVIPASISFILAYFCITFLAAFTNKLLTIKVYNQLSKLYARIDSEVTEEESIQSVVKNINFGFFTKSSVKYPPITIKEAEFLLIEIINSIDKRSDSRFFNWISSLLAKRLRYFRKYNYVFIFDEMDKVEPGVGGLDYYKDMKSYRSNENTKTYIDEYRDKKQMMVNIVSSMKNLVAETQAKFIFVAGREMFEASLAEITDRQSPLGSIFHKVIYINSFLKDQVGPDPAGLSNVIECYLKNIMLPEEFLTAWDKRHDGTRSNEQAAFLSLYYEFLNDPAFVKAEDLTQDKKIKIILALQQFIIYLTYRGNGSPKKVTRLVEDLLISEHVTRTTGLGRKNLRITVELTPRVRRKKQKGAVFYLHLSYLNQFRFGFITYLYRPYILTYSRRIRNYSDYLLVSTTYMMDHIIKFHPFAFSSKNLELLPEVLSTNRSPQLRDFIDELLQFLSYSYMRETEINLFEYKFFNKVANEILYLTNVFEDESAAFNFTLDESYSTKMHIRNKILELRSIYKDYYKGSNYEFIHSISSLNDLLGDVRFFDQEYIDAITAYSDALQALRNIEAAHRVKIEVVMLLIQLQLKIGLTYEKTRAYEKALAYYSDAMEYARKTMLLYRECQDKTQQKSESLTAIGYASDVSLNELLQITVQAFTANLFLMEKMSAEGVTLEKLEKTFVIMQDMFKVTGIKGLSNALVESGFCRNMATLLFFKNMHVQQVSEKLGGGLLKELEKKQLNDDLVWEARDLSPDFRMANYGLLLNIKALKCVMCYSFNLKGDETLQVKTVDLETEVQRALDLIVDEKLVQISDKNILKSIAVLLDCIGNCLLTNLECDPANTNSTRIELSDIVSAVIIEGANNVIKGKVSLKEAVHFPENIKVMEHGITGDLLSRTRYVFACLYLSAKYYSLAGKMTQCSFELKQILRLLNSVAFINKKNPKNRQILQFLETYLLSEILRNTSTNANGTDRSQIYKYKYYLKVNSIFHPIEFTKWIYNNISNNPETREAILLYAELRIRAITIPANKIVHSLNDLLDEQSLVCPENTVSSQWIRVLELRLQALINYKILKEYIQPLFKNIFSAINDSDHMFDVWCKELYHTYGTLDETQLSLIRVAYLSANMVEQFAARIDPDYHTDSGPSFMKLVDFYRTLNSTIISSDGILLIEQFLDLVCNSVHSLNHIIEVLQTYGSDYPAGYCFTADIYRYHAEWMQYYILACELENIFYSRFEIRKGIRIKEEIESMIGRETLRITVPMALYQSAALYYRKTLDLHRAGNTYKLYMQSQTYLEDDFNDNLSYFAAALERQRINSGNIRRNIERIDAIINRSQLFKYRSYVNERPVIRDSNSAVVMKRKWRLSLIFRFLKGSEKRA